MKQLEVTQLWYKTQHQLRADEFQIPLLHKYLYVSTNFMKTQEHIDNYSSTLTEILNQEVEQGNEIVETSKGWPDEKTIIIFLKKPFIAEYILENIEYRNVDDPHYWKAEYVDQLTKHVLACRF